MKLNPIFLAALALWVICPKVPGAETVFSGPQPGEGTTPFKVLELPPTGEGKERDPITENGGAPTALIFVHNVERSLVPLLRVLDQYGAQRTNQLKTDIVFLFADRLEGERRIKAAARSLRLKGRVGLSLDGAEGPGNYGLNKDCLMTIVAANSNRVTANFALVQPGIADAPRIIEALARTCGDASPPTVAELSGGQGGRGDGAGQMRSDRGGRNPEPAAGDKAKEKFPGAVPADPKLNALLRQCIRPTNDDATIDRLVAEMKAHVKADPDLTRQAVDGWTRVLHFEERYGTAYARKMGRQFLDENKPGPRN